ncbi:MAG: CBS domain-containing protein [Gemmatimonadales bacterium]|nr:CBS domain-containing protein [Gemmatimonadales bacterium]
MNSIKELLDAKESDTVQTIEPQETVLTAVTRMMENNIGAILVVQDKVIKGILTERDYLRFVSERGRTARETPVNDLMTQRVVYVTPDTSMDEAMGIMTKQRVRHLPVMYEGRLMGIVSIGDVVKQIGRNQETKIRFLEDYIADPYPGPNSNQAKG